MAPPGGSRGGGSRGGGGPGSTQVPGAHLRGTASGRPVQMFTVRLRCSLTSILHSKP